MKIAIWLIAVSLLGGAEPPAPFQKICDAPRIYICEHFLSDQECDHIIAISRNSLSRNTVIDPNGPNHQVDWRRTSLGTWIPSTTQDKKVKSIHKRIAEITGIPEKNGEDIQVLYYGVGAEYQPHFDYFDPKTPGGWIEFNRGGQRVATFMVYLHTTESGGETIFPKAKLKIAPQKGKAVLFYSVDRSGKEDPMSFHGGAPVIKGEKWLMTRWLREREFR
jgi:prolyl 4-hydroxylase